MSNRNWWGAPHTLTSSTPLRRLDQLFDERVPVITEAEPLTLRIRGVMIQEDKDWLFTGKNDISIVTSFQFGREPPVQRLHYMGNNVSLGWQGSFFHDTIFATRDWKAKVVSLHVQVYDVDGISETLMSHVRTAAQSVAVAFPQLGPYSQAVGSVSQALLGVIDKLDQHDQLLDDRIKLEEAQPGTGHCLLQPGYYVCFRSEVEEGLGLNQDLRVIQADGTELKDMSYAVIEVSRSYHESLEWEIDQKAAKLLAELGGKGQSGRAPIEFLRDTLGTYAKYRRLQRALGLHTKKNRSTAEDRLLEELRQDAELAPFLTELK